MYLTCKEINQYCLLNDCLNIVIWTKDDKDNISFLKIYNWLVGNFILPVYTIFINAVLDSLIAFRFLAKNEWTFVFISQFFALRSFTLRSIFVSYATALRKLCFVLQRKRKYINNYFKCCTDKAWINGLATRRMKKKTTIYIFIIIQKKFINFY